MKAESFSLMRYDADEGMVFDYAEERYFVEEDGTKIPEHLYTKTLFIGSNDRIENYKEVEQPKVEQPQ